MKPPLRFGFATVLVLLSGATLHAQSNYATPYTFTTLAGTAGISGSADGTLAGDAAPAGFNAPKGVAVDNAGNVYVADTGNHTIRKIARDGMVTTLAGKAGTPGSVDGTGSAALFNEPQALAVDSAGNVYVAGSNIRKITKDGVVTTLPYAGGIVVDSADNLYIVGSPIRKITKDGVETTRPLSASAMAIAVDNAGNIYGADYLHHTIWKNTNDGVTTILAGTDTGYFYGSYVDGIGTAARFNYPVGIAVDGAGNVYVADGYNHVIRKITSDAVVTTLAGSAGSFGWPPDIATGSGPRFIYPRNIAVDGAGSVYVPDRFNHVIRKITSSGVMTTIAGTSGRSGSADGAGFGPAQFYHPEGLAVDGAGNVYVADFWNDAIRKITRSGVVTSFAGPAAAHSPWNGGGGPFYWPRDVAVDRAGTVYVADTENCAIRKVTRDGVVTTLAGTGYSRGSADGTGRAAQFSFPQGVTVDSAGTVYVADSGNSTIRKITSDGVVTTLAGTAGSAGSADGPGSAAQFDLPVKVAVDGAGNVYVADMNNHTIRKITSDGVVTTLAGTAGSAGSADGTGSAARFNNPSGVAVDSVGNVYVADEYNRVIRKITSDGVVTTLAGTAGSAGSVNGTGSAARFGGPVGIAVDSAGDLYVTDYETIRWGTRVSSAPRVVNLSVRSTAGAGEQTLIVGFVITGPDNKTLLLRGMGPSLVPLGVVNALSDPGLRLLSLSGTEMAANDDWGGSAAMAATFNAVGAFLPPVDSKDAALSQVIPSGIHTVHVLANAGTSGVALAELYDADAVEGSAKIVNISARTQVGTGENILIAGFVITGDAPKTMLIRGLGPSLANYGVTSGFLADPQLALFYGGSLAASNDDWGGMVLMKRAFATAGAAPLAADTSKDAALLVTLLPGLYSAQVSGVGGTTGVGLVEIYLMP